MTCRVCKKKGYFLIPCDCGGVHLYCLQSETCEVCLVKYVLPAPYSWVPFVTAWFFAFVHGYLDHVDTGISIIARLLIILFCQALYCTLAHWALTLHARGLPALPLVCMFVYFSVVVYHREFLWYTILQTYLFFMHTMFLVYT